MMEQLAAQEVDVKKQIDIYREQLAIKKGEEDELTKVRDEYKSRFQEFDKTLKQSRTTVKTYEKEISTLDRNIAQLQSKKRMSLLELSGEPNSSGGGKKKNKKNKQAAAELKTEDLDA